MRRVGEAGRGCYWYQWGLGVVELWGSIGALGSGDGFDDTLEVLDLGTCDLDIRDLGRCDLGVRSRCHTATRPQHIPASFRLLWIAPSVMLDPTHALTTAISCSIPHMR